MSGSATINDGSADRERDPIAEVAAAIEKCGGIKRYCLAQYARSKLRMDGIYRAALATIPPGVKVLDLGCGVGLLGMLLAARGLGNETYGIEWDDFKVRMAQDFAAKVPSFQVVHGDLRTVPWPECSVVVLLDVLHYFAPEQQRGLLFRIASYLTEGGRLLLRVMDAEAGGVAGATRFCERVAVLAGWNRAPRVHWRSLRAIRLDLMDAAFSVSQVPEWSIRVLGNRFLVCEKVGGGWRNRQER